jgi:hypothetical protein
LARMPRVSRSWRLSYGKVAAKWVISSQDAVALGWPPSLHHLRPRLPGLVRQLRRYYAAIRLPVLVHQGLAVLSGLRVEDRDVTGTHACA